MKKSNFFIRKRLKNTNNPYNIPIPTFILIHAFNSLTTYLIN